MSAFVTRFQSIEKGIFMMNELEFSTGFVGRERIFSSLKHLLDKSINGEGQFALISGEAGIGKTRLIRELRRYGRSQGVLCLEGNCISHDVSDPYLPFIEVLSKIKGPSLVDDTQKYVLVNEAFLIHEAGKVISYASRIGANIMDEDIVGGMLSAVEAFVKDAFGDEQTPDKGLDTLVYGTIRIYIEHGAHIFLAVVLSGAEPEGIREDMKHMVKTIEDKYDKELVEWDGDVAKVSEINDIIQKLTLVRYRIRKGIKEIDIKKEKDRIFERGLKLITEAAEKNPILIVLEDIHWADVSSIQLLQYIARNTRTSRVFICGTFRPEELDYLGEGRIHPLKEAIQRMSRHKIFHTFELSRLKDSDVSNILTNMLGTTNFPNEFKTRVYQETEGNPFYIEEMLYTFFDEGIIRMEGGAWQFHDFSKSVIPSTIKDLVNLRIGRLDERAINMIKSASVIGNDFDYNVLGRTLMLKEEELITTLESLETNHVITSDPEDDELYRFNHSKIREVVYEGIRGPRKRMMHERTAESLREMNRENEENVVYQLAHHYSKTRDFNNSLKYSMMAGEKASREFALEEAYDYYILARGILDQIDDIAKQKAIRLEILVHLSDISYVMGEWDSALDYLYEQIELGGQIGDRATVFGGYYVIGDIHLCRSEWNQALENLNMALKIARNENDFRKVADSQYILGALNEKRGDYKEAIEHYKNSLKEAENVDDSSLKANAYLGIGRVFAQQGLYQKSIVQMAKSVEILEEKGDLSELITAYINLGHANLCDNHIDKSILIYEKALELAEKTGNLRLEGHGLSNLAESHIENNDLDKALKCLDNAFYIFEKIDERYMISEVFRHYGTVYKMKGEWNRSKDYFQQCLEIARELNMPYYIGSGDFEFGLMYKSKGDLENANLQFKKARDIFIKLNNQEMLKKIEKEMDS
jgi:tetratricopeptide (TPR) repeat protein